MGFTSNLSFVRKNPITTAVVTILLASGVAFSLRGGSGTTTYVDSKREFVTCTATGGLAKYAYCNWREPVDDSGSGSTVTGIYYSIGKSPAVIGVDFTIGTSATASGAIAITNLTDIATASGKTVVNLTGAYLVNSGSYVRGVTLTDPTSPHTATMMIEYITRLSR